MTTQVDGTLYEARIDHEQTVSGTNLSLFYATSPNAINIELVEGAVPDRYPGYPLHSRIESTYPTDENGKVNLITAIFPSNSNARKPSAIRIIEEEISGGIVDHGNNVKDFILESDNEKKYVVQGIEFKGKAALVRNANDSTQFYFARHTTALMSGSIGFDSDRPISIHHNIGSGGVIVSNGATIRLIGKGIETVQFDSGVTTVSSGSDFIEVLLPTGEIRFR